MINFIIPTYNERGNIKELITQINKVCKDNKYEHEIIIVDDNSPDKTGLIAKELSKQHPIKVITRHERGLGGAYKEGFKHVNRKAKLVFMMDADLSHDPTQIPEFIKEINKGSDVVQGSRRIKGGSIEEWNWLRHLVSKASSIITYPLTGLKDPNGTYKCFKKKILKEINLENTSNGYGFGIELLYLINKGGYKVKETPITFRNRKSGVSKLKPKEIMKSLRLYVKLYYDKIFKVDCLVAGKHGEPESFINGDSKSRAVIK